MRAGASTGSTGDRVLAEADVRGAGSDEERRTSSTSDRGLIDGKDASDTEDGFDRSDDDDTECVSEMDAGKEMDAPGLGEDPFIFPQYRYAAPVQGQHDVDVRVQRAQLRAQEVCRGAVHMSRGRRVRQHQTCLALLSPLTPYYPGVPSRVLHLLVTIPTSRAPSRAAVAHTCEPCADLPCLTPGPATQSGRANGRWRRRGTG